MPEADVDGVGGGVRGPLAELDAMTCLPRAVVGDALCQPLEFLRTVLHERGVEAGSLRDAAVGRRRGGYC